MKKTILLIAIISLAMSCKKQTSSGEEVFSKPKEILLNESTIFLVDGTEPMTYNEYRNTYNDYLNESSLSAENDPPRDTSECIVIDFNGNNYIFKTSQALRKWANLTPGAEEYALKLDTAEMWQNYATQRGIIDDSLQTELFTDSLIASENLTTGPNPFITALHDGYNYTGKIYWTPIIPFRPSLGSFNKKASSLEDYYILPKLNMLAEKTWFRGSKFFYNSWRQIPTLSTVGFDNKASSKL